MVHFAEILKLTRADVAGDQYRTDPSTDFHQLMADLTGLDRKSAKDANFANAYGAGVKKFAMMTNRTQDEAEHIQQLVNERAPFVRELSQAAEGAAARRGYIKLIDGARLHYPAWEPRYRVWAEEQQYVVSGGKRGVSPCSLEEAEARVKDPGHPWRGGLRRAFTHRAGNALIQGSAARQTKLAMVACWRAGIVPLLQVHDELNASVATAAAGEQLATLMRCAVPLTVPMQVDAQFGVSWGDAKHGWE